MSSKTEEINTRRNYILQILNDCSKGQASYAYLTEKAREAGFNVVERSIRNDCKHLPQLGFTIKI